MPHGSAGARRLRVPLVRTPDLMATLRARLVGALRVFPVLLTAGCVSLHAPLTADEGYPASWGAIVPLGPECRSLDGSYDNAGELAAGPTDARPVLLANVLGLPEAGARLSLTVTTRTLDRNGDASSTLAVAGGDPAGPRRELNECFCIRQTLMCKVAESSRAIPKVSIGGTQRNVYFSRAEDGALIAKLQDYHVDVVFVVPVFGKTEPWARFRRSGR